MPPMFQTLVLSLPTRNSTLRMRVWRALKECGAAVLRDGVYLLARDAALDLESPSLHVGGAEFRSREVRAAEDGDRAELVARDDGVPAYQYLSGSVIQMAHGSATERGDGRVL